MESRNDYVLREIEQLSLFLKKLIQEITGTNSNNVEARINQTSEALKAQFDLSISEIIELNDNELINKINSLQEIHIEKLAELIHEIVKKLNDNKYGFNKRELARKAIILIEFLDHKSDTFSISRMNLKSELQDCL